MANRRDEKYERQVRKLVKDFEANPDAYRDLEDFLDILAYYSGAVCNFTDIDKMVNTVAIAERIYPDSADIKAFRAHYYNLQGNFESSVNLLKNIECVDSECIGVFYELGEAYIGLNRFEKGMSYLLKIIELEPDNVPFYDIIIAKYLERQKLEAALRYFKKRLEVSTENDSDSVLDVVFDTLKDTPVQYETALQFFDAYIDEYPYSSKAWEYKAEMHYELHHDDEALDACEYAISLDSKCTHAYLTKYDITHDINVLYEALKNAPEEEQYLVNECVGDYYFEKHIYPSAAPYYRKAVTYLDDHREIGDNYASYFVRNKLAKCYQRMGDLNSAEKLFFESVGVDPYSPVTYGDLVTLYKYGFRDSERFEQAFLFLIGKFKDCKFPWMHYLEFLLEHKRYENAVEAVNCAQETIRDDDDLYIVLAVAYYHTNRKNEALLLLNNMECDIDYLMDAVRDYSPDMLLDNDVMDIMIAKRDEKESKGYYNDNDSYPNAF